MHGPNYRNVYMDHSLNQTYHSFHTSKTAIYGQILVGVSIPIHFSANTTNGSHYVHIYVNMNHSLNQTSHSSHTSKTVIYRQILVGVFIPTYFAASTTNDSHHIHIYM